MRRLLCTALLLLCCAYGCIAAVVQPLPKRGQGPWDTYTVSAPDAVDLEKKKDFKPIRFAVSAKEVDRVLKYCKQWKKDPSAKDVYDNEYGFKLEVANSRFRFCKEESKMTAAKKRILLMDVLPAALKLHSERLSIDLENEKLKLPFNETHPYPVLPNCTDVSIPKEHREGIPNADFMLYVGLTDAYKPVKICSRNENNHRPTSALIKFIPREIAATRHYIRFAAHEVAHALGFDIEIMKENNVIDVVEVGEERNKKKVPLLTSTNVLDKVKAHYGCSDDNDIKRVVFENDRRETDPLHWERRIAKEELMSTYTVDFDVTGAYYTALTLAVFDSMPFYRADFKMAESMNWGKNASCDFLKDENKGKDKDTVIKKYPEMFCNEIKGGLECTSDRFALGRCTKEMVLKDIQNISPEYAYFNDLTSSYGDLYDLTDGYPIIKPIYTTSCESGNLSLMPGSIVGNTSRCLKGDKLKLHKRNKFSLSVGDICADVKCDKDNEKVMVRYSGSEIWHNCSDGKKIDVEKNSDFQSGSIFCPKYAEVCTDLESSTKFPIEYDKDEEEKIKKEEEQEKKEMEEEKRKMEEEQRKMEEEKRKMEEKERQLREERSQVNNNSQQVPPKAKLQKKNHSDPVKPQEGDVGKEEEHTTPNGNNNTSENGPEKNVISAPTSTPVPSETTIPSSENNINTTTSSIPENVIAAAAPATVAELNNTQMGQALNQATAIVIVGADSSISASYQIPLLLLLSALVTLASP
ncbi:surface protease GP63 [Trypanosoma theileri]|uniref:Leishmanolysin-like peptidase n=1 Tax=Trypanosoma theileri TaxID=67003 RepID=A0A1X0NI74_9TRYP|nr:surface protease GP63 [Trypanosoma theileri]ORC84291.1 surface protease GP63 [Trypanosoma theileri]